jgi:hypothetical protein
LRPRAFEVVKGYFGVRASGALPVAWALEVFEALFMVVDEELKMMAKVCAGGGPGSGILFADRNGDR